MEREETTEKKIRTNNDISEGASDAKHKMAFKSYSPVHHPAVQILSSSGAEQLDEDSENDTPEEREDGVGFPRKFVFNRDIVIARPLTKGRFR